EFRASLCRQVDDSSCRALLFQLLLPALVCRLEFSRDSTSSWPDRFVRPPFRRAPLPLLDRGVGRASLVLGRNLRGRTLLRILGKRPLADRGAHSVPDRQ